MSTSLNSATGVDGCCVLTARPFRALLAGNKRLLQPAIGEDITNNRREGKNRDASRVTDFLRYERSQESTKPTPN
jgi:hypothetical protein